MGNRNPTVQKLEHSEEGLEKDAKGNDQLMKSVSVMSELIFDSKCTRDPQEKAYLHKLLNNRKLVMILIYRGSRDGWGA